jgi:Cdc6-like AAA superfamily ATPase
MPCITIGWLLTPVGTDPAFASARVRVRVRRWRRRRRSPPAMGSDDVTEPKRQLSATQIAAMESPTPDTPLAAAAQPEVTPRRPLSVAASPQPSVVALSGAAPCASGPHSAILATQCALRLCCCRVSVESKMPDTPSESGTQTELVYKIMVVGNAGCGKTSIIKRFVDNVFSETYKSTVGADFSRKVRPYVMEISALHVSSSLLRR